MDGAAAKRLTYLWQTLRPFWGAFATVDDKTLGIRYPITALGFLVVGGIEKLALRLPLAAPESNALQLGAYNQLFSMHGIALISGYASPILSAFGTPTSSFSMLVLPALFAACLCLLFM